MFLHPVNLSNVMSIQFTDFEKVLNDLTGLVNTLLKADYGLCYIETSPGLFKVLNADNATSETTTNILLRHEDIRENFSTNFKPEVVSNRPSLYVHHSKNLPKSPGDAFQLLYLPFTQNGRLIAFLEIVNPHNREILPQKKPLKALQNLAQDLFMSRLRYRSSEEMPRVTKTGTSDLENIIGSSPTMKEMKSVITKVAATDSTVLIKGETGTGKNIIAHSIHDLSGRRGMPFIKVNCAAIPENLLESELFGHEKGSFTGAIQQRIGRFELAHLGTIFLDEIGEITQNLQVKLLNVLQDREFERLGGTQTIKVNVRIISATNKDLETAIENREFRQDLFYRLNVLPITVPPLRDRIEDFDSLADHFVPVLNHKLNLRYTGLSDGALFLLKQYEWPGNIRELENVIERAMVIGKGPTIEPSDLPKEITESIDSIRSKKESFAMREGQKSLWDVEKGIIERALQENEWNQSKTARQLGITRNHLRYRIKKYGIIK